MNHTIMLCFRDLVTQPGDSIDQHKKLISRHGHCWWGWWMKPIEDVPNELLLQIVRSKKDDDCYILLYDCGQYKLYTARLTDIVISPTNAGMSSPGIDETPEYYVHIKCRAWFKFANIDEVQESETKLQQIKYIDFPSWRREATHDVFKGKSVSNFQELDEMAVTLWHVEVPAAL